MLAPTTVGVVAGIDRLAGNAVDYHLSSGATVKVDFATARILLPDGGPSEGDLLLSGIEPAGRMWVAGLKPNDSADVPPGCYQLLDTGIGTDGFIDLSIGVRLPKAPEFDPGPVSNERYDLERVTFCVNERGEVLSYG